MKRKKSTEMAENVVDLKEIMDQKKINNLCDLDYDEFKFTVTRLLLSMAETIGENNKKIDKSFKRLIRHLKAVSEELKFIKRVLYMERILNGEHRDGRMTMGEKTSLAKYFGIDFDEFIKELSGKNATRKGGR
jgi:hypothetical protein